MTLSLSLSLPQTSEQVWACQLHAPTLRKRKLTLESGGGVFTRAHMYKLRGGKKKVAEEVGTISGKKEKAQRHFNLRGPRSCNKRNWGISEVGASPALGYLY